MSPIFRCCPLFLLALVSGEKVYSAESTFLYEEQVGAPYVDDWFLIHDASEKPVYHLQREGKSGELQLQVTIDCSIHKIRIEQGILFGSERISEKEAIDLVPDQVFEVAIASVCKENK